MKKLFKLYEKFGSKIVDYFNRPEIDALNKFEAFLRSPSISVLSMTFEEWVKKSGNINKVKSKDNIRKHILGIFVCIYGWLTVIKFYLAAIIKDPNIWPLIGDPFYLTGDRVLFNLVIGSIALNASLMRTLFLIGERDRKLVFIRELYRLQTGREHHLIKDNFRKINIRCTLSEQLLLKQIPTNALVLFSLIYGYYTVSAYLRQDYNYTIVLSLIWWALTTFAAWVAASMQGVSYSLLYLSQYYLKLRFRQVRQRLQSRWNQLNSIKMRQTLSEHNQMVELTVEYNNFFCEIVAVNYLAATLAINLLLYIAFLGNGDLYFRIGSGMIALNKIGVILLATYSSALFSDEVHRLYGPLNSMLIAWNFPFESQMKIIQLIERLSGPTIGFYCYDIFAFDIINFFRYMIGCVGVFFLMVGIITTYTEYKL